MTSEDVAELVDGACSADGAVVAQQTRIDSPITIAGARLGRLELREIVCRADVTIADCRIDVLEITKLELARGAALGMHNCVIDTIELRSFSGRGSTTLESVRVTTVTAHAIGRMRMLACSAEEAITLSRVGGFLTLEDIVCGELVICDLDDDELRLELADVSCQRELEIHSGSVLAVEMSEARCDALRIRRVVTHAPEPSLLLASSSVRGDLSVDALASTQGSAFHATDLRVGASLAIGRLDVPAAAAHTARLSETFVAEELRLAKQAAGAPPCALVDTSIAGTLRLTALDAPPRDVERELLDFQSSRATDITLPPDRLRGRDDVNQLATRIFGDPTIDGLTALRTALAAQHRPLDEDAVYALLQDRLAEGDLGGRLRRAMLGDIFGWGVRLGPPARAFVLLMIATAIVLLATGAGSGTLANRIVETSLGAIGLWTNVDVEFGRHSSSNAYALLQALCGAGGLVLITVLVGIVIRKLVR